MAHAPGFTLVARMARVMLGASMKPRANRLARARLESPQGGVVELTQDWSGGRRPALSLAPAGPPLTGLTKVPDYEYGWAAGYYVNRKGRLVFVLPVADLAQDESWHDLGVFVAGDFNGWAGAGQDHWRLHPATIAGKRVLECSGDAKPLLTDPPQRFKFVTGAHHWLPVPGDAPNAVRDESGNTNRQIDPARTGQHLFKFTLPTPLDLSRAWRVKLDEAGGNAVPLVAGDFFCRLSSDVPMGVSIAGGHTTFRIFAPRASRVELALCDGLDRVDSNYRYSLARRDDGAWEIALDRDLDGWYYWYHIDGPKDAFAHFDFTRRILDPYALATVGREGPGIVLDRGRVKRRPADAFRTPAWHDLVVMEAHVRDLVAQAPVELSAVERRGFTGLRKWIERDDCYLHRLGINCIEIQPVQEADNLAPEEYHWGYMTVNWFAPASAYGMDPARASQIQELKDLVATCHARGIAVILDVVYNHVGEPAHLLYVDKLYYFELTTAGDLYNWSGCGNDYKASSAMALRLIIESCTHLVEAFGIDGFRFDLAELIGVGPLKEIEAALKRVKPDIILIAEPWSFRGHIAGALTNTGWASWNDGYRNFLREIVRGGGTHEATEYFLKGSPWYFAHWPAQTVNYTESHDDRTWIDVITENKDGNGHLPTFADRRRTHLMGAFLFMSIGIPMLSAGQDFLRSKQGVNNTYQRGDLNALDYRRPLRFPASQAYFAGWIALRRSSLGRLLRLFTRPADGYFKFEFANGTPAFAVFYNADLSLGWRKLLFAFNPALHDVTIPLGDAIDGARWRQLADAECFYTEMAPGPHVVERELFLPALSCSLWVGD